MKSSKDSHRSAERIQQKLNKIENKIKSLKGDKDAQYQEKVRREIDKDAQYQEKVRREIDEITGTD